MRRSIPAAVLGSLTVFSISLQANPIPVPTPASMPLEEMTVTIDAARHVSFSGDFTFDSIPTTVAEMLFPLPPVNASNVTVRQDGVSLLWSPSSDTYPTVLPEYPLLSMFEWVGPFPAGGAVFTVEYEHDLFLRGSDWVFFYSLGTGKYFPTYDKLTTAIFEIYLPSTALLKAVLLDNTPVDPSLYTLTGSRLDLTLTSEFGPFTKDLVLVLRIPEPATLGLLSIGLLGMLGRLRRSRQLGGQAASPAPRDR
jgi:hypothetical protein